MTPDTRWRTAREIGDSIPDQVQWAVAPWLVFGAITELIGKIKAAGKTTFLMAMIRCIVDGAPFLGQPTVKSKVILLTEQPDASLRKSLAKAGLLDRDDLLVLSFWDVCGDDWPAIVTQAIAKANEVGARVLVVDTLGQWTRVQGDGENTAGDAGSAIEPLQVAAAKHGLAVLDARHERKAGGDVADAARGSSAIGGAVDIILVLRRLKKHTNPARRELHALSRFDETPELTTIELTDEGYRVVPPNEANGAKATANEAEQRQRTFDALPAAHEAALTVDDLVKFTRIGRSTVQTISKAFVDEGVASRFVGVGGKGYRYHRGLCDICRPVATTARDSATAATTAAGAAAVVSVSPVGGQTLRQQTPRPAGRAIQSPNSGACDITSDNTRSLPNGRDPGVTRGTDTV